MPTSELAVLKLGLARAGANAANLQRVAAQLALAGIPRMGLGATACAFLENTVTAKTAKAALTAVIGGVDQTDSQSLLFHFWGSCHE